MNAESTSHPQDSDPVVSVVKIQNDDIGAAVEQAIDLLGGVKEIAQGKQRIMLKPNLVTAMPEATTNPEVIRVLAELLLRAGRDVSIGEGSAAAGGFNATEEEVFRTSNREVLDEMQQFVFDELGYSDLAQSLGIPLINLHSGEMIEVPVPNGLLFDRLTLHHSLGEIDLLCSVPMMKTHMLATVTLGMKNLIGLYPGTAYCSVRACVHDQAADAGSPGIAWEIVDMVRANKLGLTVVDGSMAMEGDGPTDGKLVKMDVIIAGTNPLATDMVAANVMGFEPNEIPTLVCAMGVGMQPQRLDQIEVRGEPISAVKRALARPTVYRWDDIRYQWGVHEIP
jgi:uncharacterized protein (DUF362 family)